MMATIFKLPLKTLVLLMGTLVLVGLVGLSELARGLIWNASMSAFGYKQTSRR